MKRLIPAFIILPLLFGVLSGCGKSRTKPLEDLKAEDIVSADIWLAPPDTTITISEGDDLAELVVLLNDVVLYKQDDTGRLQDGQLASVTVAKTDGSTVSVGAYGDYMYYNGVCYQAKYEPSNALNTFCNSFYKELPDKGTPSDTPESDDAKFLGVSHTAAAEAHQDKWGVKLTVKDITSSGLTIVCRQQDGAPTGELQTGSPFTLERLDNGPWVEVETIIPKDSICWTMEAWRIMPDEIVEWSVDWSYLYGELPAGSYRISKSIMDFRGSGDYDQQLYYAGFDIIEKNTDTWISVEHEGFGVSLPYVDGWEYEIEEYAGEGMSYGINYRPVGENGWIRFHYWDSFGVCGTGLKGESYGKGYMGTYDDHKVWDFISFPVIQDSPAEGSFVAMTQGVDDWWPKYGDVAMEILDQMQTNITIVD